MLPLIVIGCLVSLGLSAYWLVRISGISYADFGLWVPIIYAVLPIIALALTMGAEVRRWARQR